jgi:glycosyltransferase involved in cell wall biosynthesis
VRVALVHDFLNQAGGAERVLAALHRMFPGAPIFTTIADRGVLWPSLQDAEIHTSWMQHLPSVQRHYRRYLPLYPRAIESLPLADYDLVISSSSAFAKGALTGPRAFHVCYCHNPMRFVWEFDQYVCRERFGPLARVLLPWIIERLRAWDLQAAWRPNLLVANSSVVSERIRRYYGRASVIVFPPVDVGRYRPSAVDEPYYLIVSRLLAYKRIDLAIEAFNQSGQQLLVVGEGLHRPVLQRMARPNIRFLGRVPEDELARYYARCRGVVLPGEEDFGIVPLEANAAGRPVIAFGAGGALDTVEENRNGILFREPTPTALGSAVATCDAIRWDKAALRQHAERFREGVFCERFLGVLHEAVGWERRRLARRARGRVTKGAGRGARPSRPAERPPGSGERT